jgi:hypothetical protein
MGALGGIGSIISAVGRPSTPPIIADPTIDTNDWGSTIGSLIGTGVKAWQTQLQTDLLSQQIKAGQTPSIVAGVNGTPSAGFSYTVGPNGAITYAAGNGVGAATSAAGTLLSSGLIWIVLLVLVVVLVLKR